MDTEPKCPSCGNGLVQRDSDILCLRCGSSYTLATEELMRDAMWIREHNTDLRRRVHRLFLTVVIAIAITCGLIVANILTHVQP